MAHTLTQLIDYRARLVESRVRGIREVQDQSGERVVYKSDNEMSNAIAFLDAEISAFGKSRISTVKFHTSKGL